MACSRFEYVKNFERENRILENCWFIVRIDGRGFKEFCSGHGFAKPNDDRCIQLMNRCALEVMKSFGDTILAYGQSDEFSFVFKRDSKMWNRRETKLVTNVVSFFTSCFIYYWSDYFPTINRPLYPPSFDGRIVCYPTNRNLKDYLKWRQTDCHINNQYNACFWSLVNSDKVPEARAYEILKGTVTADKNEMLFTKFGINYNELPALHRKGTVLIRIPTKFIKRQNAKMENIGVANEQGPGIDNELPTPTKPGVLELNVDLINEKFWEHFSFLLDDENN